MPKAGAYHELLNSDADYFGGSNVVNASGSIMAEEYPWMNHPHSLTVTLPPLASGASKSQGAPNSTVRLAAQVIVSGVRLPSVGGSA